MRGNHIFLTGGPVTKKSTVLAVVLALIAAGAASPASASTPLSVSIVSLIDLESASGTFSASGPGVEAGLLCPAGEVYDLGVQASGYPSGRHVILRVHKLLVCQDGSGDFTLDLNVFLNYADGRITANWRVVAGSLSSARLHGTGKLFGTSFDGQVLDQYEGKLHID